MPSFLHFAALAFIFALTGCKESEKILTIYTSLPERDTHVLLEAFEKEHPGVDVSFFRSGTNEVISKLRTEFMAERPKADVILLADDVTMMSLKREGRLQKIEGVEVKHLLPGTYDQDHTFFGTVLVGTGLVYHKDFTPPSRSLRSLSSEAMRGKVVMASPIFSGSGAINLSLIASKKELGWEFWDRFMGNDPLFVKGNGSVMDTVLKRGRVCGVIVDFMALNAIKDGASLNFHYFSEGTPMIHEPIAILKGTPHMENALKFVKFILSIKGQNILRDLGYRSIRGDVSLPKIFEDFDMTQFHVMPMDPLEILNRIEQDREQFAKLHG
jgi:iron(III) transport system substrate-binding protein